MDELKLADLIRRAAEVHCQFQQELHRRGSEFFRQSETSRETVCSLVGMRASSMLMGLALVQRPSTLDSWDVLMRAHMEAANLFLDFGIVDGKTDSRMKGWLKGKDSWKADMPKVEAWVKRKTGGDSGLRIRSGMFSKLTHPTHQACRNSVAAIEIWFFPDRQVEVERHKAINYLSSLASMIAVATCDDPGLVPLGLDDLRMPDAEQFRTDCSILVPYLQRPPAKPDF